MKNNHKPVAKDTPAQTVLKFFDPKVAPNVAMLSLIALCFGLLSLVLGVTFEQFKTLAIAAPKLMNLGYILITVFAALVYGAKLQRIHYRLDK